MVRFEQRAAGRKLAYKMLFVRLINQFIESYQFICLVKILYQASVSDQR
jgi:hypothetical protein